MENFENNMNLPDEMADTLAPEVVVNEVTEAPIPTPIQVDTPVYNPIVVDEVVDEKSKKSSLCGLKVFAFIMALVIVVSSALVGGYLWGKKGTYVEREVNVGLESKPANTDEMTTAQVYNKVSDSIVGIIIYNDKGAGASASGVIYTEDGYIVTNDHIYSGIPDAKFKIYTQDGKEYDAVYVAGDIVSDLAVLKIDGTGFKAATFGNSDEIIYGESVVAIGCPNEPTDKASITRGIISAVDRRVQTTSSYSARLIQTDSPINPGSSGGALVNMYGQVIGITSAKLVAEELEAVGYAIPTTTMKYIVEELIKEGRVVSRAKLGISYFEVTSIYVELGKYKYVGLLVDEVSADSDLYGKLKKGDTIIKINDMDVTEDAAVLNFIEKCRAGDKITVTVIDSEGNTKTFEARLKANIGESSYKATKK